MISFQNQIVIRLFNKIWCLIKLTIEFKCIPLMIWLYIEFSANLLIFSLKSISMLYFSIGLVLVKTMTWCKYSMLFCLKHRWATGGPRAGSGLIKYFLWFTQIFWDWDSKNFCSLFLVRMELCKVPTLRQSH